MIEIKKHLKENNFLNLYLFFGDEDFLKDYYCEEIAKKCCDESFKMFNYLKITNEKPDSKSVSDFVDSYPVGSDKKVLIIKNSTLFKKSTEAEKKFWTEILSDIPDYLVIIFCEQEVDKRSTLFKIASKSKSAEFKYQKTADLKNWTMKIAAASQKMLNSDAAQSLCDDAGPSMYNIKTELDKLISFVGENKNITKTDVEKVVCKNIEGKVFSLIDSVMDGDRESVFSKLENLKLMKEPPVMILVLISRQYSMLRKMKILVSSGADRSRIIKETGVKEYFLSKYLNYAKKFSLDDITQIINDFKNYDEMIKNGQIEQWNALYMLIAKCI